MMLGSFFAVKGDVMTRLVEFDGQPFALLLETTAGTWLVPPIVRTPEGEVIQGHEVLDLIKQAGVAISMPVASDASPASLALIDQRMKRLSDEMGVPIWSP